VAAAVVVRLGLLVLAVAEIAAITEPLILVVAVVDEMQPALLVVRVAAVLLLFVLHAP
jgi:hypothetical protein